MITTAKGAMNKTSDPFSTAPGLNIRTASSPDLRSALISVDSGRHSGAPCFAGTRVPVQDLFDYLEGGENLDSFLASFPSVSREQAIKILELAEERLLDGLLAQ